MNRIKELVSLLTKANEAYYTDAKSLMEDERYDKLREELKTLDPDNPLLTQVGASVSGREDILQKKTHTIPMGSLNKASNENEFRDWFKNNILKVGVNKDEKFHVSYKLDGGSYSLEYKNGKLITAISRGDGQIGCDISANARKFRNVPLDCKLGGEPFTGFVRGEVILTTDEWRKIDPLAESNPRNLGTGIAGRKDGTQAELLNFYAFRLFDHNGDLLGDTEEELSQFMTGMGFEAVPYIIGGFDEAWGWYKEIQVKRPTLPYWIDGVVVKLNDLEKQSELGESSGRPRAQVAIKFEAEGGKTVLRGVSLQVGNTGAIVPVGNFDSVKIGGTNIMNATLCNWENIKSLDLFIGDEILVIKAGDIIPRVMEVTKKGDKRIPIPEPTHCPVCNSEVERKYNVGGDDSTAIYCFNKNCPALVTGHIDRYLSSLDVLGIGDTLIQSLVTDVGVKTIADLYTLDAKRDKVASILLSGKTRLGEKRADKFLEGIDKIRSLTLSEFLGSLGVFGLGKRRVALIQAALPGKMDTLDNWLDDTLVKNAQEAGVPNIAARIHEELVQNKALILECLKNGVTITKPAPKSKSSKGLICITGALSISKSESKKLIEAAGYTFTDSFSKDLNFLVAADPSKASSKLVKAQKHGIRIISEEELMKLVG
jgi:DNA ligase (NAD+)